MSLHKNLVQPGLAQMGGQTDASEYKCMCELHFLQFRLAPAVQVAMRENPGPPQMQIGWMELRLHMKYHHCKLPLVNAGVATCK